MMIHKILFSSFILLTMATCQNQKGSQNSKTSDKTENVKAPSTSSTNSTPAKDSNPEISTGLPPDKEAVKQTETQSNSKATQGDIIYLKEGENQFLKQYEMNVTFKGITEDSRCPKDVNCIWAGVATAEIEVMGTATRPVILKISTMTNESRNTTDTQNFNGYNIKLIGLSPETTTERGYKALKGSYKIALKFEKGTLPGAGTTTK